MSKSFNYTLIGLAVLSLAACSKVGIVDQTVKSGKEAPIGFVTYRDNMTRATALNALGIYNFGVWGYKYATDMATETGRQVVMNDYLVGYAVAGTGYPVPTNVETYGNTAGDGHSLWYYKGLGSAEYTGPLTQSTQENQYMKYWDLSTVGTNFYAYTPYNAAITLSAPAADGKVTLNLGAALSQTTVEGTAVGLDAASNAAATTAGEIMYASNKVVKSNYGKDVALSFKHIGARVRVAFYEDIDGYTVKLVNLTNAYNGVQATPAATSTGEAAGITGTGSYTTSGKGNVVFDKDAVATFTPDLAGATTSDANLVFNVPAEVGGTADWALPTEKTKALLLPTSYYVVPQDLNATGAKVGLTFHVSYQLTAEDTQETITVYNAEVFVPSSYCTWAANTQYTYIFKITKAGKGGTTDPNDTDTITPLDPTPGTDASITPIVFDGIEADDWTVASSTEHVL